MEMEGNSIMRGIKGEEQDSKEKEETKKMEKCFEEMVEVRYFEIDYSRNNRLI